MHIFDSYPLGDFAFPIITKKLHKELEFIFLVKLCLHHLILEDLLLILLPDLQSHIEMIKCWDPVSIVSHCEAEKLVILISGALCLELTAWISSRYSGFLPPPKDVQICRLIAVCKIIPNEQGVDEKVG